MTATLVTGGLGFIGASLTRALVARGDRVRVLDNTSRGSREKLGEVVGEVEIIEGDIRDPAVVRAAVDGMERVCHLAYVNGTSYFYEHPDYVLDVGVKGMVNVIDACIAAGVPELVLASSSETYQTPPVVPTPEDVPLVVPDPRNPRFSYGGGKIVCELMALHYAKHFQRSLIFRPHNVYGPDMGFEHVIPQFVHRLKELSSTDASRPLPFAIQGDGSQTRSFVYIDDFTDGLLVVLDRGENRGIYNIGTTEEVTIAEVARGVGSCLGIEIDIVPGAAAPGGTPRRCPDISKLQSLGFNPKSPFAEGLATTVTWYAAHPPPPPRPAGGFSLFLR